MKAKNMIFNWVNDYIHIYHKMPKNCKNNCGTYYLLLSCALLDARLYWYIIDVTKIHIDDSLLVRIAYSLHWHWTLKNKKWHLECELSLCLNSASFIVLPTHSSRSLPSCWTVLRLLMSLVRLPCFHFPDKEIYF